MSQLSTIIVNWNGRGLIEKCIQSVLDTDMLNPMDVYVVDNRSKDDSVEFLQKNFPEITLIKNHENIGFGAANNVALSAVKTPFAFILNPDTVVNKNAISAMLEFLNKNEDVGLVGCQTINENGGVQSLGLQGFPTPLSEFFKMVVSSERTRWFTSRIFKIQDPKKSGDVRKLYGGCMMARMTALEETGYFDERFFMYCEDVDLCKRLNDRGWRIYYLSEVHIQHTSGGVSRKAPKGFVPVMQSESIAKLMEKYYGRPGKIRYRLLTMIASTFRIFVLTVLWPVYAIHGRNRQWKQSQSKYISVFRWTVFSLKPFTPE